MKFLNKLLMREGTAPATPPAGYLALYTVDGTILLAKDDAGAVRSVDASLESIQFSHVGALTVGTGVFEVPIKGGTFNIVSIAVRASTAPTGASAIFDVNKNGTTIFGTQGNRPTIAAAAKDATVGAYSVTTVTTGDYLSVDVDQIGSTVAGSNAVVYIRLQRVS